MKNQAKEYLEKMYGYNSDFREGQLEAIESVLKGNKTLVVQRTGWGKSTVYFIATKFLRNQGKGVTILISPLLSLMRNQIESASRLGIVAETINSDNQNEWDNIKEKLSRNQIDLLLISPERLGNHEFITEILPTLKNGVGLFVVDEAHCISDWGHDFRPDYQRIVDILQILPTGVPVLATTATANNRVIEDIISQFGNSLVILRGPLLRESLSLQVIKLKTQAERMAWLCENIECINGSGIIYCLTTYDCNIVAGWLQQMGINALEYHSKLSGDNEENNRLRTERENLLLNNEVKALVSTVALGMGYDKGDLSFVIHYQRPGSVVSYYQQIGRAGRSLDDAKVVLLTGQEDDEIQEYFIQSAFPTSYEMETVVEIIKNSYKGLKKQDILNQVNISSGRLDKCLKKLTIDNIITKQNGLYIRTANRWDRQDEKSKKITEQRYHELQQMKSFVEEKNCFMKYIGRVLDDPYASECQKCTNCTSTNIFPTSVLKENVVKAEQYLKSGKLLIQVRKKWPAGIKDQSAKTIPLDMRNKEGKVLSSYGDAGWGSYVRKGKYEDGYFSDELVKASAKLIREWKECSSVKWITYIPSIRRPELVKSFAERLAFELNLPIHEAFIKSEDSPEQKSFQNSYYQCNNAFSSFKLKSYLTKGPVLLIDDMVDSGWTFVVCGSLLKEQGVEDVYPFALASTTVKGG